MGISEQNRDRLDFFLQDPLVRFFLLVFLIISIVYIFPILSPDQMEALSYYYADLAFLSLLLFGLQYRLGRLERKEERIFWHLLTIAFVFWWSTEVLGIIAPALEETNLPDILIAVHYFFLLIAIDNKPHLRWGRSEVASGIRIAGSGGTLFVMGLLVYFVLISSPWSQEEPLLLQPSLAFIVVLDLFLIIRFIHLFHICRSGRWRVLYGWMVLAIALGTVMDFLSLLIESGKLHWVNGSLLGVLWMLPFVPWVAAIQLRHYDFPPEETKHHEGYRYEPVEKFIRSRNYRVIYAIVLPVIHFGLYAFNILDSELRDAREVVVLVSVLALGALALVDRMHLEGRSHAVFRDWRQAEEALRLSERRYRSLVDSSQGLICTHDMEERFLSVNPAAAHLLGYEPEEMVGRNFREFLAPWSLERIEEYLEYLKRDETDSGLLRVLAKDGTERVWVYKSTLLSEPGQAPVVLGHAQDITERIRAEEALRRSEAKFRTLVEDAPNAIVITSLTGQIVQVNRTAEKMFGYASDELLGQGIELLIPEQFHKVHRQHLAQYAAAPQSRPMGADLKLYARRKDGNEFPVEIGLGIFETEEGPLVGATVLDITERKEVENLKDELISIVSHELRTPLTSIRGSLGLLAAGLLGKISGKAKHMLEVATNNTDRLVRLLNDILDIQRMEAGRIQMVPTVCDARELMESVGESMQPMAEEAGVTLQVDSASAPLWADHDRIIQVLTNLISNAIKFSSAGGTVRLLAQSRGDEILFQVCDEGRGIPSHKQEVIFDRFQQVDVSDARVKGGAGLGLAISRKIVEEHGGRIWVESAPGQGSTFSFTLPLKVKSPVAESV